MSLRSSHYFIAQDPKELRRWAVDAAKAIVAHYRAKKLRPLFCYTGMSGVSHATALALALQSYRSGFKFGMAYVRKDNEKSHGNNVETAYPGHMEDYELVFVDDFVMSGTTFKFVQEKIHSYHRGELKLACLQSDKDWKQFLTTNNITLIK